MQSWFGLNISYLSHTDRINPNPISFTLSIFYWLNTRFTQLPQSDSNSLENALGESVQQYTV